MAEQLILALVFLPFIQALLIAVCRFIPARFLGFLSALFALGHFSAVLKLTTNLTSESPATVFISWVPDLMCNLAFKADGLALFFALLITGMGVLVFFYSHYLMPADDPYLRRFYVYLNVFMGAMLGAVLSDNFLLLFLFWETTSVASYMLISYHTDQPNALLASRQAFLTTALTSLGLLIAIALMGFLDGTLNISQIAERGVIQEQHPLWVVTIMVLLLTGVAGKSAQFPFHYWLPQAMAAPTPVSAYLHSATMVKLGIYLTARSYGLFAESEFWFPLVTTLSLATVLIGGIFALFARKLKQILAYATVSQLGFFISFYGIADPQGLQYDYLHIFNHALYKASLFMLVGILAKSTGATEISDLRGIARKMPLFSVIFVISVAAMAGVPGTTGFLSKELLVNDILLMLHENPAGTWVFAGLLLGLLVKVAFSYRLIRRMFYPRTTGELAIRKKLPLQAFVPPLLLSSVALILGILPKGLEIISNVYAIEGLHHPDPDKLAIWHGFNLNLAVSVLLFAGGISLYYLARRWEYLIARLGGFNMSDTVNRLLDRLPKMADSLTQCFHFRRPEQNLLWIFSAFVALTAFWLTQNSLRFEPVGELGLHEIVKLLIIAGTALLLSLSDMRHRVLALGLVGFLVAFYFVLRSAPDVAMTQMLVELATLFILVMLAMGARSCAIGGFSFPRALIAAATGLATAVIPSANGMLSDGGLLGRFFNAEALPTAKGANVVNTILVDFRGLDTLGEIAVIAAAVLGVAALLQLRRRDHYEHQEPWIPSPLLPSVMGSIFILGVVLACYLLLRGHNAPGGGFAGGVTVAAVALLVIITARTSTQRYVEWLRPIPLVFGGLFISVAVALLSWFIEGKLLVAYFYPNAAVFNTPLVFDIGIMLLVIGAVTALALAMRQKILKPRSKS